MKPVIDPISGLPYLSHVNDIETIATLRREVERLTDILIASCNAAGGQAVKGVSVDFLARVPAEIAGRIDRLTKDLARSEAETAACLDYLRCEMHWENFRAEMNSCGIDPEKASFAERNAAKLLEFLNGGNHGEKVLAERDQLREQLAAAQKDSERMNWLEADMPTSLIAWTDAASGCRLVQAGDSRGIGQDVRSAIDAARTK